MDEAKLIDTIKEIALEVYQHLGAGYIESIYEEAMAVEMRLRNLDYVIERTAEVFYKDVKVGTHRLDFIVDDRLVVELKAASSISKSNKAQLLSYLKTLHVAWGVLINFPYPEQDAPDFQVVELVDSRLPA